MKRILVLLLLVPLSMSAACGGDGPEDQIGAVVDQMNSAGTRADFEAVCHDLFTTRFIEEAYGDESTCVEEPLKEAKKGNRSDTAEVDSVSVDGDRATARVTSTSKEGVQAEGTWRFVDDDGWRLDRYDDDFLRSSFLASVKAVDEGAIAYEPMRRCMTGQVARLRAQKLRSFMFQTMRGNRKAALRQVLAIAKGCPRQMAGYVADELATKVLAEKDVTPAQIRCAKKKLVPLLQATDLSTMAVGQSSTTVAYALAGLIAGVVKQCPAK